MHPYVYLQSCMQRLQKEVAEQATANKDGREGNPTPRMYTTPAVSMPLPQPIKIEAKTDSPQEESVSASSSALRSE